MSQQETPKRLALQEGRYREALAQDPSDSRACHLLGLLCFQTGRTDEALELIRRSVELDPDRAEFVDNLAAVLGTLGRLEESLAASDRAVALRPNCAKSHVNRGVTLEKLGRPSDAIAAYRRGIEVSAGRPVATNHLNLANALRAVGEVNEAEAQCRRTVELDPRCAPAWHGLANVLAMQSRSDDAVAALRRAVELEPTNPTLHSALLYALHYVADISPVEIFEEHVRWARHHAPKPDLGREPFVFDRSPRRKLRVGYVSPDFRHHSVATFFEPLLRHHDHGQLEVILYSATDRPDGRTIGLGALADGLVDIAQMNDATAAARIRSDEVDVLVDLTGHMAGGRLGIFARRPAPVQVTYVGHPNTTGMASMDYRLSDPVLDPPGGHSDARHAETLIRLPRIFGCYQLPEEEIAPGPLPATLNGRVTFGCLNNPAKVTQRAVDVWCEILHAVPGARLVLLAHRSKHLLGLFALRGIDPAGDRLELLGRLGRRAYLEAHRRIDVALDTFPYNGQTTTCDALWMGVPVIGLRGDTYVSRMGLDLLGHVGLDDLVAGTTAEYRQVAVGLASDLERLTMLRRTLRGRLCSSPITDGRALAREVESAYRQMWRTWCRRA